MVVSWLVLARSGPLWRDGVSAVVVRDPVPTTSAAMQNSMPVSLPLFCPSCAACTPPAIPTFAGAVYLSPARLHSGFADVQHGSARLHIVSAGPDIIVPFHHGHLPEEVGDGNHCVLPSTSYGRCRMPETTNPEASVSTRMGRLGSK